MFFHREIFPEGLPPAYVFVATLRSKSPAHRMKFDLMRVLSQDGVRQMAVTVNGADKSVTFTCTSTLKKEQTVIFNDRGIKVHKITFICSSHEETLTVLSTLLYMYLYYILCHIYCFFFYTPLLVFFFPFFQYSIYTFYVYVSIEALWHKLAPAEVPGEAQAHYKLRRWRIRGGTAFRSGGAHLHRREDSGGQESQYRDDSPCE